MYKKYSVWFEWKIRVSLVLHYFNCRLVPDMESDQSKKWLQQIYFQLHNHLCFPNFILPKFSEIIKYFAVITVSSFLLGCQLNFLHFMIWGSNCCWFIQNKPFWQQILSSYKYESRGDFLLSFFTFELRACLKTQRDSCNT